MDLFTTSTSLSLSVLMALPVYQHAFGTLDPVRCVVTQYVEDGQVKYKLIRAEKEKHAMRFYPQYDVKLKMNCMKVLITQNNHHNFTFMHKRTRTAMQKLDGAIILTVCNVKDAKPIGNVTIINQIAPAAQTPLSIRKITVTTAESGIVAMLKERLQKEGKMGDNPYDIKLSLDGEYNTLCLTWIEGKPAEPKVEEVEYVL